MRRRKYNRRRVWGLVLIGTAVDFRLRFVLHRLRPVICGHVVLFAAYGGIVGSRSHPDPITPHWSATQLRSIGTNEFPVVYVIMVPKGGRTGATGIGIGRLYAFPVEPSRGQKAVGEAYGTPAAGQPPRVQPRRTTVCKRFV